jgi:hypothetical protein
MLNCDQMKRGKSDGTPNFSSTLSTIEPHQMQKFVQFIGHDRREGNAQSVEHRNFSLRTPTAWLTAQLLASVFPKSFLVLRRCDVALFVIICYQSIL